MSEVKQLIVRLVSELPGTLQPLTIYMVKADGASVVEMFVTSEIGAIAAYSVISANGIASSNSTVDTINKVSQAEYDALSPPDPKTLYIIVD